MASAAMLADIKYAEVRPARAIVDRYYPIDGPRFVGDRPEMVRVPTGLAPELTIETTVPANPMIVGALLRLLELKSLPANWDSYGSQPVAEAVFRPVLELIIEAVRRCKKPTIVPLAEGGIGLRWEEQDKALELDVLAEGSVEAYCESELIGEPVEPAAPLSVEEATQLLIQYCRA